MITAAQGFVTTSFNNEQKKVYMPVALSWRNKTGRGCRSPSGRGMVHNTRGRCSDRRYSRGLSQWGIFEEPAVVVGMSRLSRWTSPVSTPHWRWSGHYHSMRATANARAEGRGNWDVEVDGFAHVGAAIRCIGGEAPRHRQHFLGQRFGEPHCWPPGEMRRNRHLWRDSRFPEWRDGRGSS